MNPHRALLIILNLSFGLTTFAQSDSTVMQPSANSCQSFFGNRIDSIQYSYDITTQTHDYSGNWDFDGDGETDGLFFIGTGGAHLYFYLRIALSSDKKIRDFPFLALDFPCVGNISDLKGSGFYPPPFFPQFVVNDFYQGYLGENINDKIYLHLDKYSTIPKKLKRRGVNSNYLLLQYENGDITIRNFIR